MTILDTIAAYAKTRVEADMKKIAPDELKEIALGMDKARGDLFYQNIAKQELSFICEVKKASPSKGVIDPVFDYLKIAKEYERAGADAISCLTEPKWFLGSDEIFREIREKVALPMLRKDFVVDSYQLYQAKVMGANCILLICALLDTKTVCRYLEICDNLGLAALVETHDEEEIKSAVSAGAHMIGVNNRNLKDFSVNLENAKRLREMIPSDRLFVAESGVMKPEDAAALRSAGADAILVGEAMMRAEDTKGFLSSMRNAAKN